MSESLFQDRLAARLRSLSIITGSKQLGHHKGMHRSSKMGSSLDFSDYRSYHPGDDLRHIDWNIYARTDKPFIKQYLDEQEMRIHILLDATASMSVGNKWRDARRLAISIGHIALVNSDNLSFSSAGSKQPVIFRKKGAAFRPLFTRFIEELEIPEGAGSFCEQGLACLPKKATVIFIISDGLEPVEQWELLFRKLPGICKDIRVLFLQTEKEAGFIEDRGDIKFVDIESRNEVEVTLSAQSIRSYVQKKEEHEAQLAVMAKRYGIQVMQLQLSGSTIEDALKKMRYAGWIR